MEREIRFDLGGSAIRFVDPEPFSKDGELIMEHLIQANQLFNNLSQGHPSDQADWLHSIHALQNLLMSRVAKRNYPKYFK